MSGKKKKKTSWLPIAVLAVLVLIAAGALALKNRSGDTARPQLSSGQTAEPSLSTPSRVPTATPIPTPSPAITPSRALTPSPTPTAPPTPEPTPLYGEIILNDPNDENGLTIYAQPDPLSEALGSLVHGDVVRVLGEMDKNGWLRIEADQTGFVTGNCVTVRPGLSPASDGSADDEEDGLFGLVSLSNAEGKLNMRQRAETGAPVVGELKYGDRVRVLAPVDRYGWMKVSHDGTAGYVSGQYIAVENAPATDPEANGWLSRQIHTVESDGSVNMRQIPHGNAVVLASLPNGTHVSLIDHDAEGWAHIGYQGLTGYVKEQYVGDIRAAELMRLPYYIEVDRTAEIVRVFTVGEDGTYSILAREMICSTEKWNSTPHLGGYLMHGRRDRWSGTIIPGTYVQYATIISGSILFHSLPYSGERPDALQTDSYELLGQRASHGCVRLLCADAKWIFDNVPDGTPVFFVEGERDEEKLAALAPPPLVSGKWDPTDPSEANPDYDPSYEKAHEAATPYPGVTPAPTESWKPHEL